LQAVRQHRTISLDENVTADVDSRLGIDAENVRVVCAVVDAAEPEAIADQRLASRIAVFENVCRIEQLGVTQAADGTLLSVGTEHQAPEVLLMQPLHHGASSIAASSGGHGWVSQMSRPDHSMLVGDETELKAGRIVANHIDGEDRVVDAGI